MSTTLERRPRELDPAATTNPASVIIVDDPAWPYARSLSKDKWHTEFKGDDQLISFTANLNEPSAAAGKLSLFFDGSALKAKLPDGSLAIITQVGVGLYQSHDPTLDAFAQAASGSDLLAYFSGVDSVSTTPFTAFGRSLLDDMDAAAARATLGTGTAAIRNVPATGDAAAGEVVLGSDSRLGGASDPTLAGLAALSVTVADRMFYSTGVETFGLATLTAYARSILDDADAATARTTLGLGTAAIKNTPATGDAASNEAVLGSDTRLAAVAGKQAADATLTALAGLTTAVDQGIYATGADAFAMFALTAFGRSLLGSVAAANARTTLGLGTLATLSTVGTTELGANAVTYAKMQNVSATDKLLGRATAGAGVVEEIACTAFGRSQIDDVDAAAGRTTLGLGSFATKSIAVTADITDANITYAKIQNVSATDKLLGRATAGAGVVEEITCTPFMRTLLDDIDAATHRTTLGLGSLALLSSVAYANIQNVSATDKLLGRATAGAGVIEEIACTAYARTILDDIDAATSRTTLGLGTAAVVNTGTGATNAILGNDARLSDARASTWGAITGTLSTQTDLNTALSGKQPLDATLTALAALATGADQLAYSSGTDTFAQTSFTTFGRSLVGAAAASNARTTLGLGGAAVLNIGTTTGTAAAGDDGRFTDSRALLTGTTVPQHFFTQQTAKTGNYTLVAADSGTVIPMNAASGVVTIPTYAAGFLGFACELYAVQAFTINGTTTGTMALAAGESVHVRALSTTWKVSKMTPTAFT